jgi:lysine decarboxylase
MRFALLKNKTRSGCTCPDIKASRWNRFSAGCARSISPKSVQQETCIACEGIIAQAEKLAAAAWWLHKSLLLYQRLHRRHTGALLAGLPLRINAYNGTKLPQERLQRRGFLDLTPVYVSDPAPEAIRHALEESAGVSAVCVTSPEYFGRCRDISAISGVCRKYGVKLIVDEAHGAHLPFMEGFSGAVSQGRICPAPPCIRPAGSGQCAILPGGDGFSQKALKTALTVTNTSSPSYPLMASMDIARAYMQGPGRAEYARAAKSVSELRRAFPSLNSGRLDPCRFVLVCRDGFALEKKLQAQGIYPEMADEKHIVFIITGMDADDDFARLRGALEGLSGLLGGPGGFTPLPESVQRVTPGTAFRAKKRLLPLKDAVGAICAQIIAPYPPAQPVITYGEEISQKHIAYLYKKRYNMMEEIFVAEPKNGL